MTPGQLLWRHRRGQTLGALAKQEGVSRYKIFRIVSAERWRVGEVVVSEKALRKYLKQGLTIKEMADLCCCSTGCISKKLKQYKLKTRPRGNPKWAVEKCEKYTG